MRQIIGRLLEGKFNYEKGKIDFSCPRIELELSPDELYNGTFNIYSSAHENVEGFVVCHDIRMHILNDTFTEDGANIGFAFSAKGLEEGDVVKGEIDVISNRGEYYLPYVVTIAHSTLESSLGSIRNLFHFANLAKTDWDEAVKLFYSDRFRELFKGNDRKYLRTYIGLSSSFGNELNVEEFLLEINKKQPIEFIVAKDTLVVEEPHGQVEEYIDITRNGWGYTYLYVSCDSEFVTLSKETVTDADFLGNYLHYGLVIDSEKLHGGNNYALVRFYNSFISFEVTVKVQGNLLVKQDIMKNAEKSNILIDMVTFYTAFRLKRITAGTWTAQTGLLVDRLMSLYPASATYKMFKAQLLIAEERYNEAQWILDRIESDFLNSGDYASAEWAYFLYLTTLINREESYIDQISDEVENIYNRDPSKWQVAWLLLYLSQEYAVSPSKKWLFIENQLLIGCISPVMYVEAANMLSLNPALLAKLDRIEQRVLLFMLKEDMLNSDVARQVVFLAESGKWFSPSLLKILQSCYELLSDKETLDCICTLLIAHDKKGPEYFQWYKLAIEEDVRVTKIYEYYMLSLDISRHAPLPKMVYLYFSYQNELDWKHAAYLYARVIEQKNDAEMEEIFTQYKETIDRFALDEIANGHMNRDLAVIYRFVLNENLLYEDMAVKLAPLIFTHRISVESDNVSRVIVYQGREIVGNAYPIVDREAYVPIYNRDFVIMFEDNFSNRYMKSVPYDIEKLMVPGKLANMLLPYVEDNLSFDVYACECSSELVEITDENRCRYQRILDSDQIDPAYKTEIRSKLLNYYYDNDAIRELDNVLNSLTPEGMGAKERNVCLKFMIQRGMYDKAIDWIYAYGTEGVDLKNIVKLCSHLIQRSDFEPNETITSLAALCFFNGKHDETVLKYLCDNFFGLTKDLRKLFTSAQNFDLDVSAMCENLLIQIMYTGYYVSERMDIYKTYLKGTPGTNIRLAFLSQCCFDFFVKDQLTESFVFEELTRLKSNGEGLLKVCMLAYVKYYSENPAEVDDTIRGYINEFLGYLVDDGIYFSYFKEFMEQGLEEINRFTDKTFVEYKTEPGRHVFIHYIIECDDDSGSDYITAEMPDMYGGLHSMSFVLFFGENLLYYITEEINGDEQLTESGNITKSDISSDIKTSRFSEINDIVISHTLSDYDALEHLIYDYRRKDYLIDRLFTMK